MGFKEGTVCLKSSNTVACSKNQNNNAHHVLIKHKAYHRNQVKGKVKPKYKGGSEKGILNTVFVYSKELLYCPGVNFTAHMHITHAGDFIKTYIYMCLFLIIYC
jgi:hypothetical protein